MKKLYTIEAFAVELETGDTVSNRQYYFTDKWLEAIEYANALLDDYKRRGNCPLYASVKDIDELIAMVRYVA